MLLATWTWSKKGKNLAIIQSDGWFPHWKKFDANKITWRYIFYRVLYVTEGCVDACEDAWSPCSLWYMWPCRDDRLQRPEEEHRSRLHVPGSRGRTPGVQVSFLFLFSVCLLSNAALILSVAIFGVEQHDQTDLDCDVTERQTHQHFAWHPEMNRFILSQPEPCPATRWHKVTTVLLPNVF